MDKKTVIAVSLVIIFAMAITYAVLQGDYFSTTHNVAVAGIVVSSTQLYKGDTLNITVIVRNAGTTSESFNITAYWNSTKIGMKPIQDLASNSQNNMTFGWNTSEAQLANYIIKAEADTVTGETNTTDNVSVFGVVRIRQKQVLPATMFVDSENNTAALDQNFSINVNVANVADLIGWELRLSWNTTLLEFVNSTEGAFLKTSGSTVFYPAVNATVGRVAIDCTLIGDKPGVSGNGTLVSIQFHVRETGLCDLSLFDTTLLSSFEEKIIHTTTSGHFTT